MNPDLRHMALASVLFTALSPSPALAQIPDGNCPGVTPEQPIEVSADASEMRQEENIVLLEGKVDVRQGPLSLRAAKMTIHYTPSDDPANPTGTISKLDARGAVRIQCADEKARGENALYDVVTRRIKMTGDVLVTRGGNILQGNLLTIDLNTGRSRIESSGRHGREGSDDRVRAIFQPPPKDKAEETTTDTNEKEQSKPEG